jgi:hypothetical protein
LDEYLPTALTENDELIYTAFINEILRSEPQLIIPVVEYEDPILVKLRSDCELPQTRWSSNDVVRIRTAERSDTEVPIAPKCIIDKLEANRTEALIESEEPIRKYSVILVFLAK